MGKSHKLEVLWLDVKRLKFAGNSMDRSQKAGASMGKSQKLEILWLDLKRLELLWVNPRSLKFDV